MNDDPELVGLRACARAAEERYHRIMMLFPDPATIKAAHAIWGNAEEAVQAHEVKRG